MKVVERQALADWIGHRVDSQEWWPIDQARINAFADATLDYQFIHVDLERARHTPLGSTIAHGFLLLSLLSHFAQQCFVTPRGGSSCLNYGLNRVRFIHPVPAGTDVRASTTLLEVTDRGEGGTLMRWEVAMYARDRERPVMVAEWLCLWLYE